MLPLHRSIMIWKQLKNRTHNPKKNISFVAHKFTHTVGDHMPDDNAKVLHMGNLKECGVTTKLKLRDAMKRGAAIRMPVVLSQISDLFATKLHLYVARYVQAITCEF